MWQYRKPQQITLGRARSLSRQVHVHFHAARSEPHWTMANCVQTTWRMRVFMLGNLCHHRQAHYNSHTLPKVTASIQIKILDHGGSPDMSFRTQALTRNHGSRKGVKREVGFGPLVHGLGAWINITFPGPLGPFRPIARRTDQQPVGPLIHQFRELAHRPEVINLFVGLFLAVRTQPPEGCVQVISEFPPTGIAGSSPLAVPVVTNPPGCVACPYRFQAIRLGTTIHPVHWGTG